MRDFRRDQSGSAGLLGPFEGVVMGPKVFHKSLSRLETSQSTPLFSNYIFYCASFWRRSPLNRSKCENSILRKRVYSFKHSGNSRGDHWGPEKVCVFWQSGLKMSDFAASQRMSPEN